MAKTFKAGNMQELLVLYNKLPEWNESKNISYDNILL